MKLELTAHSSGRLITYGDTVVLYLGPERWYQLVVTRGNTQMLREGAFVHDDMVGRPYGSRMQAKNGRAVFAIALPPSAEVWPRAFQHRTQILYRGDISQIIFGLELSPGMRVVESGTGSGALTCGLIQAVAPHGHVYTYEYNADRASSAQRDFAQLQLSHTVTVTHRDVCEKGFAELEDGTDLTGDVDAVFLDLPCPWLCVSHARKVLRASTGRLCSFSPCIEQVQSLCEALASADFVDISTVEVLLTFQEIKRLETAVPEYPPEAEGERERKPGVPLCLNNTFEEVGKTSHVVVRPQPEQKGHSGYLTFARLKGAEVKPAEVKDAEVKDAEVKDAEVKGAEVKGDGE